MSEYCSMCYSCMVFSLSLAFFFKPGEQTGATLPYIAFLRNLEIDLGFTLCVCVAGGIFIVLKYELAS